MAPKVEEDADCHFLASGTAALVNFPLWRASAIAQSGFQTEGSSVIQRYIKALGPPYRGVGATLFGMTWARGAIFYFSDAGKHALEGMNVSPALAQTLPPLVMGTLVQVANQPLVRATITIQDPASTSTSTISALRHIYSTRGVAGLWHGTSAAVMKTVPKYICAIVVRDFMEANLPKAHPHNKNEQLLRAAVKSTAAGLAGAALTNPLDVLRNEMFKTDKGMRATFNSLMEKEGWAFMTRGMASNMTAVAAPIAMTIFLTDLFKAMKHNNF